MSVPLAVACENYLQCKLNVCKLRTLEYVHKNKNKITKIGGTPLAVDNLHIKFFFKSATISKTCLRTNYSYIRI